jgi:two-component system KDP operon response regulator KdpE
MSTTSPRILMIEDEAPIRRFLRVSLGNENYEVTEAETAEKGIKLAASMPPDLIILDLGLPDLDGMEVIRQLRDWSTLPIIVLSARGRENDKVAALDAGADDYLTKPFSVSELLRLMKPASQNSKFTIYVLIWPAARSSCKSKKFT